MLYEVRWAEIKEHKVELPHGAIPIKLGLMFTKSMKDLDNKLVDGVCYLINQDEVQPEDSKG